MQIRISFDWLVKCLTFINIMHIISHSLHHHLSFYFYFVMIFQSIFYSRDLLLLVWNLHFFYLRLLLAIIFISVLVDQGFISHLCDLEGVLNNIDLIFYCIVYAIFSTIIHRVFFVILVNLAIF